MMPSPARVLRRPSVFIFVALFFGVIGLRAAAVADATEQWGIYELALKGPADGNPFMDVRVSATFTNGSLVHDVPGFYDGNGMYRVRFMPEATGEWHYETQSNQWQLTGKRGAFTAKPPASNSHGPVRVHNTYHFAYADGTPYRPFGTTIYNWLQAPDDWQEQTLKTLAASPFNKIRMLVFPQDTDYRKNKVPPTLFPYEGKPRHQWDYTRFSPAFFQKMEQRIGQLRELGIEADVILFNPYGKSWGFDTMTPEGDDRYLRYIVARLSAYRNVWWSMANEYDFLRTKTDSDWDRYFQIVQKEDPYNHLRSIHNGSLIYNHNQPWVTHVSIQNGAAVEEAGRAEMYRDVYRKPIVYDEVKYEGTENYRWGQLTAPEMVQRIWSGTVAGTYVGHGECYLNDLDTWLSYGGVLRGESPPRIAFLRKILEEGPADGLNPIDRWQDPRMGGEPGQYYLVYFGTEKPANWTFELFRDGLADGMQFKIDVIDTWAMTITPVNQTFVAKKKDRYSFVDGKGSIIPLRGKPYMALRIQRVDQGPSVLPEAPNG
jgi:hypothetical protein